MVAKKFMLLSVLLFLFIGQTQAQIEGPNEASSCELVRVDTKLAENQTIIWVIEPELDFESIRTESGSRIVFTLGENKKVTIRLITAKIEGSKPVPQYFVHEIVAKDSDKPVPTPDPGPITPDPDPDPDLDIKDWTPATEWSKRAKPSGPTQGMISALEKARAEFKDKSLQSCGEILNNYMGNYLERVSVQSQNWNPFLTGLASEMNTGFGSDLVPQNYLDMIDCVKAIEEGLRQ